MGKRKIIGSCIVFLVVLGGGSVLYHALIREVEAPVVRPTVSLAEGQSAAAGSSSTIAGAQQNGQGAQTAEDTQPQGDAATEPRNIVSPEGAQTADATVAQSTSEAAGKESAAEEPQYVLLPDFTLRTAEGEEILFSSLRGKPVVLNFWASWCGPCRQEMSDFDETYGEAADEVHFAMVNLTDGVEETVEAASAYVQEEGYTFPVYYDVRQEAAALFGIYAIPTTFFVNAEGYAMTYYTGALSKEQLQDILQWMQDETDKA